MAPQIRSIELEAGELRLEPLSVDHADEMVAVLADESTYEFTGGSPPTLSSLRAQYEAQTHGESPDGTETWLNWVIRWLPTGSATGYVQATLSSSDDISIADIAWVVAPQFQGRGVATAAARAMTAYLREQGVVLLRADVHPDHIASQRVAASVGLRPTAEIVDGEIRWEGRIGD